MKILRYENGPMDDTDLEILNALADNARVSTAALARQVGLSAPSVSERIRRLEDAGVINGYTIQIDPAALGRPLSAWLRVRPTPGEYERVVSIIKKIPEIVECNRITGDDCFIARVHVASVQELERLIDELVPYAITNTSIVQSSPVEPRLPPIRTGT